MFKNLKGDVIVKDIGEITNQGMECMGAKCPGVRDKCPRGTNVQGGQMYERNKSLGDQTSADPKLLELYFLS